MRIILLSLTLLTGLLAEEPKKPLHVTAENDPALQNSTSSLLSENALLKAQIEQLSAVLENLQAECWNVDLFQSRYRAAIAMKKARDLQQAQEMAKSATAAHATLPAITWTGGPTEYIGKRDAQIVAMIIHGADGWALYDQRGSETPDKPWKLELMAKSLEEAKAGAKSW